MKRIAWLTATVAAMEGMVAYMVTVSGQSKSATAAPVFEIKIPREYRDFISSRYPL
jgi:hypothetical protein